MPLEDWFPKGFDLSALKTGTKTFDAMLIINEKAYVLWKQGKLIKHGSGFLGRNVPKVCHAFLDDLCKALFTKQDPLMILQQYSDLTRFSLKAFCMSMTVSKRDYFKTGMYAGLMRLLKHENITPDLGTRIKYVKTTSGYVPLPLLGRTPSTIDFEYYKLRCIDVYCRLTFQKPSAILVKRLLAHMQENTRTNQLGDYS